LSLNSPVFPDVWETAKVKPLYKKGDKYDVQNYRTISIKPVFAKLLERLMYTKTRFFQKLKMVFGKVNLCYSGSLIYWKDSGCPR